MSATLMVLAAGLGSRFNGGIKQLTPVGESGELLLEYAVYDAAAAGFDKVIFIIRPDIEAQFKEMIGDRIAKRMRVEYCIQDMSDLPPGFDTPEGRTKPWGTVHAVIAAKEAVKEPFVIINADDYYGKSAFEKAYAFLTDPARKPCEQCMAGFVLKNTLSDTGTVTRGVCTEDNGALSAVTETYKISRRSDGRIYGEQDMREREVDENSRVSMNMWGFDSSIIPQLSACFEDFLAKAYKDGSAGSAEYPLPKAVDRLISDKKISVRILPTEDKWYGMTYKEDCPEVIAAFKEMTARGEYPSPLFA